MKKRIMRIAIGAAALVVILVVTAIRFHRSGAEGIQRTLDAFERVSNVISADLLMELPRRLRESSGVAVSVANPGLFWTHNDSGHDPILYGLRPADGLVAEVRLVGATAHDWEDISMGPCLRDPSKPCVYIGDIGNNRTWRTRFDLFVLEEPRFDAAGALPKETAWDRLEMSYDGGARDAEALAVSATGDLLIVGKGGIVFRVSRDDLLAGLDGSLVVLRLDEPLLLPPEPPGYFPGQITAATFQGDVLIARSYGGVFFFRKDERGWTTVRRPCWVGHLGPMGEGMDVARPDILYLTREAHWGFPRRAALHRVVCGT